MAHSICPEGNTVMHMLDVLQLAVADKDFADPFHPLPCIGLPDALLRASSRGTPERIERNLTRHHSHAY